MIYDRICVINSCQKNFRSFQADNVCSDCMKDGYFQAPDEPKKENEKQ